jgi:hypothetical protein
MDKDEALKMAQEALESCGAGHITDGGQQWFDETLVDKAITAIKQARTPAPVQKRPQNCGTGYCSCIECVMEPAQRTWVGLTNEKIDQGLLRTNYALKTAEAWRDGVGWAMTQLREKNAP